MKFWKIAGIALVVVLAASLMSGFHVFAQSDETTPTPEDETESPLPGTRFERKGGMRGGRMGHGEPWMMDDVYQEAIAEALGLTVEELQTRLEAGERLSDIAEAQGVDEATLQEALNAARVAQIEQAVADGELTQEEADEILERMAQQADLVAAMEALRAYQIEQALKDGAITQDQADLLNEFGGKGFGGCGGMRGGRMGFGGRMGGTWMGRPGRGTMWQSVSPDGV